LRDSLKRQKASHGVGDQPGFHLLDLAFHDLLTTAAGYRKVRATVEAARLALDRARRLLLNPRRHADSYREHCAVVEAIEAGDPVAARAAMRAHIDSVMGEIEEFSRDHPEVFAGRDK
jgi:GntR family transcriptional regulator, rspAB operon transcriptional repressor